MNLYSSVSAGLAEQLLQQLANTAVVLKPRFVDRPLALYAAGDLGKMAADYFQRLSIPVQFVVDRRAEDLQLDDFWQKHAQTVCSPKAIDLTTRCEVLLAVCVVTIPYTPVAQSLAAEGWENVVPFYDIAEAYRDRHPLSNGWFAAPFSTNDINAIQTVLAGWADDRSRAHHLQFMAWRRLREEWLFEQAPITTDNRFFIPEILAVMTDRESFADIGAHIGSVSERFVQVVRHKFRRIWALEPDKLNGLGLMSTIAKIRQANDDIQVLSVAVGEKPTEQGFFQGLGYASQCSALGQDKIAMVRIDDLGLTPSFIKLHLEGAELAALKGARQTLQHYRPIVVATVYHNQQGIAEAPQWLMQELPDYKFYMRLHSYCGTGAVIYCIPNERKGA